MLSLVLATLVAYLVFGDFPDAWSLAGIAVTPGPALTAWQVVVLGLAVLVSSASAGAFNQYFERDLDVHMGRTRRRPFVSGKLSADWRWPSRRASTSATSSC